MPTLLKRLSETANPDAAFLKFNEFLVHLPAGVQLFSLFNVNPHLLGLIADIMGSAPTLAEHLSRSPALLDAVISADFYGPLPSRSELAGQLAEALKLDLDFEQRMDGLRRFRNEKQFQAGVQLLKRMIDARQVGAFMSDLADVLIQASFDAVNAEFTSTYGTIKGSSFAVIGLGKLGSRELTFGSDIDLVFVYDTPDAEALSDGDKSFNASVYYNRFAQRFLNALTAMGSDGRLYEVDTRLRPSGKQGAMVVSLAGLEHYFNELAWTFEYMAFTKARVIVGEELKSTLGQLIVGQLRKPRDKEKLRLDVIDMRERIAKEFGADNPWDIKYVRGGLMDIDFIAQYLMLLHAPDTKHANPGSAMDIFAWLKDSGRIDAKMFAAFAEANIFLSQIFHMLRLCSSKSFDETTAPTGLKKLLCESVEEQDFAAVKEKLLGIEQSVYGYYIALLKP
jgi:[glutamine synthetase] adenylyltransferase / [glutamine synthetase]-adenylyl-L-tyrosine phosphorylase